MAVRASLVLTPPSSVFQEKVTSWVETGCTFASNSKTPPSVTLDRSGVTDNAGPSTMPTPEFMLKGTGSPSLYPEPNSSFSSAAVAPVKDGAPLTAMLKVSVGSSTVSEMVDTLARALVCPRGTWKVKAVCWKSAPAVAAPVPLPPTALAEKVTS